MSATVFVFALVCIVQTTLGNVISLNKGNGPDANGIKFNGSPAGRSNCNGIPVLAGNGINFNGIPANGNNCANAMNNNAIGINQFSSNGLNDRRIGNGLSGPANNNAVGNGDVAVVGELPVTGSTAISGNVPVIGYVTFEGVVPAGGLVSVVKGCGCN